MGPKSQIWIGLRLFDQTANKGGCHRVPLQTFEAESDGLNSRTELMSRAEMSIFPQAKAQYGPQASSMIGIHGKMLCKHPLQRLIADRQAQNVLAPQHHCFKGISQW